MVATLGFGKRRLVNEIIKNTWGDVDLKNFKFSANDLLYIMQEMAEEEGKKHLTKTSMLRGHHVFRKFVEHLLYRNLANYDSMVLITSEKGCVTDDCLIQTEDYPKGISIKKLIDKGPLKVYSYNSKTKQIELKQSDGVMFAKYAETCELTLKSGHKLKATLDHPVVLEDGTKKQIQNLCDNDNVLYVKDGVAKLSQRISIKLLGKQNVYDVVNVEDNHNFICNSIVTKNTGKSSAAIMIARFWCQLIGIRFDPKRHLAYSNKDVMEKIKLLNAFEPLVADESVRFASSSDWAKKESKELRKVLAQVRTKHLLFILCFPLKIHKMEKNYLESFVNYWVDLFGRGVGAIYVKDRNPSADPWRVKDFKNVGAYTEFTSLSTVEKKLKKHPNFWQIIKFPKPPAWLYSKYLEVREKNVYNESTVRDMVTTEDIHKALLVLALQDIMMNDKSFTMNRIILFIKNRFDIPITKKHVQALLLDAKQLVTKIREESIK